LFCQLSTFPSLDGDKLGFLKLLKRLPDSRSSGSSVMFGRVSSSNVATVLDSETRYSDWAMNV
jgi:hypothetical protein